MVDVKLILLVLQTSYCLSHAFLVDGTCQGRCGAAVDATKVCQCNTACVRYNDCCSDYNRLCVEGTTGTCDSLAAVSAELWTNDVNRLSGSDITFNYQTQVPDGTTSDKSTQKFFTHVNEAKLNTGTYKLLIDLLNNYDPTKGNRETATTTETQEENAFLDAILGTSVMNSLLKYLTCKGIVTSQSALKATLKKIWFDFYPRSGTSTVPDTSGFEHVIVGEYKDGSNVNGFHNWVSFYEKEKSGSLNYFGYVRRSNPLIVGAAFSWSNRVKTMGSFFIGVSPEFEIAVYSLCFLTNPGKACQITLDGSPVTIMSYSVDGLIATAYESENKTKQKKKTAKKKIDTSNGVYNVTAGMQNVKSANTMNLRSNKLKKTKDKKDQRIRNGNKPETAYSNETRIANENATKILTDANAKKTHKKSSKRRRKNKLDYNVTPVSEAIVSDATAKEYDVTTPD